MRTRLRRRDSNIRAAQAGERGADAERTSWQLALMATTSIALSIASGWTTWDGMTQFTSVPLLSALITFGIQGVMLVTAWLIGESIVARRHGRSPALVSTWPRRLGRQGWRARSSSSISPAALWIMFAMTLTASVFFSFDSLFNEVFSDEARIESGRTRVASAASDVIDRQARALDRKVDQAEADLFASEAWRSQLASLAGLEQKALALQVAEAEAVEASWLARMHAAAAAAGDQRELEAKLSSAQQQVSAVQSEIAASKEAVAAARQALASADLQASARSDSFVRKQAEAEAEARGVGATSKSGRGPRYRQLMREATALAIELETAQALRGNAQRRVDDLERQRERASVRLAALQGEAAQFEARLTASAGRLEGLTAGAESGGAPVPAEKLVATLRQAVARFTSEPAEQRLESVILACADLRDRVDRMPTNRVGTASSVCRGAGVDALARTLFTARETRDRYAAACGAAERSGAAVAGAILRHAEACISLAALPGVEASAMRELLRDAELRRDDRAHRLIVSWNAFSDLNPLAALALAIALGIDGLVFFSGVCGALARGLHTSAEPARVAACGRPLEDPAISLLPPQHQMIQAALAGHGEKIALHLLERAHPVASDGGPHHAYDLRAADPSLRPVMARVLNAGMVLGLLRYDEQSGVCVIPPGFYALLFGSPERRQEDIPAEPAHIMPAATVSSPPQAAPDDLVAHAGSPPPKRVRVSVAPVPVAVRFHNEANEAPAPAKGLADISSLSPPRIRGPKAAARMATAASARAGGIRAAVGECTVPVVPRDVLRELERAGTDAMGLDYPVGRLIAIYREALEHARSSDGSDAAGWRRAAAEARRLARRRVGFGEGIMP